jgi:hypothetical protein
MTEAFEAVVPVTKLAGIALPAPVTVVLHVWAPGFRPVAMPAASVPEPAASGPVVTLPGVAVLGAPWIASLGDLAPRRVANDAPALILTVGDVLGAFEAVAAEGADVIRFPDIAPTGTLFDDMFRVSGPVVARAEFDAWTGGHLTDGLARAVRHELQRRGWTHERLAAHLGLSRKHTTNLINDQFGTCSIVAARLKAWLLQGAMGTPLAA